MPSSTTGVERSCFGYRALSTMTAISCLVQPLHEVPKAGLGQHHVAGEDPGVSKQCWRLSIDHYLFVLPSTSFKSNDLHQHFTTTTKIDTCRTISTSNHRPLHFNKIKGLKWDLQPATLDMLQTSPGPHAVDLGSWILVGWRSSAHNLVLMHLGL